MVGVSIYLKVKSKRLADGLDVQCERKRRGKDDSKFWDSPPLRQRNGLRNGFGFALGNSLI